MASKHSNYINPPSAANYAAHKKGKVVNLKQGKAPVGRGNTTAVEFLLHSDPKKTKAFEAKLAETCVQNALDIPPPSTVHLTKGAGFCGLLVAAAVLAACIGKAEAETKFTRAEIGQVPPINGDDCIAVTLYDGPEFLPSRTRQKCRPEPSVQLNMPGERSEQRHADLHGTINKDSYAGHKHVVGSATQIDCVVRDLSQKGFLSKKKANKAIKAIKELRSQCPGKKLKAEYTEIIPEILPKDAKGECAAVTLKAVGPEGASISGLSKVSKKCGVKPEIVTTKHEAVDGLVRHSTRIEGSYYSLDCILMGLAKGGHIAEPYPSQALSQISAFCPSQSKAEAAGRSDL